LLAIVAAFFLSSNQKKSYKSVAQLSTGYTVMSELKLSDEIFNLSQIDVKFNNAIADMNSAKVMSLLSYSVLSHDLSTPAPFRKPDPSAISKNPDLKNLNKTEALKILANKRDSIEVLSTQIPAEKRILDYLDAYGYSIPLLRSSLYIARNQRTDYINITFRSEVPELSAFVVNALCKEFQRYNDVVRKGRAMESAMTLDSLTKQKKRELDEKISAKVQFMADSVSSSIDPTMVGANALGQIGNIEASLAEEEGRVQDLTYQISQINQQLANAGGPVTSNNSSNSDNSQWLVLRKSYYDLRQEYMNSDPKMPEMKKRLDDLEARMNAAAPTSTNTQVDGSSASNQRSILTDRKISAEGQLRSATFKINGYRNKLAELNGKLRSASPASSASLDKYDKEIEFAQTEYTNLKEKLNLASGMNDALPHNFRQTVFAQPSLEPEPSKRLSVIGLAGLCAFILSCLVFIFIAYIDQSIKTPSQFLRQTDLKLLGTVNLIDLKHGNLAEQVTQVEQQDAQRNNSFRELLRKLRYEIEKSGKRVILFTSTEPRQGKTTLTQALAFSLHLSKKKVVILDTNFCNNDITSFNGALPTLETFSGNGQITDAQLEKLVSKTALEYVDIIGCKGGDYTPTEILPKNHLLNYLPDLLKKYDYVFMEAAPLNGFTDTKELTPFADGVIAIFSATLEVKQNDKESIKFLRSLDGKFIGAILNKVTKSDINL
jgi:Mrp family chromosome partitioning ATPase/uncharacterized protein involved in exopolysaccharide biosynthesis